MKYQGQDMHEYLSKWEQISAQLEEMNASCDEGLMISMFFESFVFDEFLITDLLYLRCSRRMNFRGRKYRQG